MTAPAGGSRSVAADAAFTAAQSNTGYWRIGYDSLSSGWTGGIATDAFLVGSIGCAAAYRCVLTASEVRSLHCVGLPV